MKDLSYGILIGGKSSRMGRDKAFLRLREQTFLERIIGEFKDKGEIILSVGNSSLEEQFPYTFVNDEIVGIGPIEGIRQILKYSKTEYVFICACDMPFLKYELTEYMAEYISNDYGCFVITDGDRIHPLCTIYSKKVLPFLEKMIADGDYKLRKLFQAVPVKYIDITKSCYPIKYLENINTRAEYKQIEAPLVFCVSGRKNSGKTTLIAKLVTQLKKRELKVGVIKHDGHDFDIDYENTDTWKFNQSGADSVAIYSSVKSAVIRNEENQRAEDLINQMQDMDIIIMEGLKESAYPKLEVVRSAISEELTADRESTFAIVTDGEIADMPVHSVLFSFDDIEEITDYVLGRL